MFSELMYLEYHDCYHIYILRELQGTEIPTFSFRFPITTSRSLPRVPLGKGTVTVAVARSCVQEYGSSVR